MVHPSIDFGTSGLALIPEMLTSKGAYLNYEILRGIVTCSSILEYTFKEQTNSLMDSFNPSVTAAKSRPLVDDPKVNTDILVNTLKTEETISSSMQTTRNLIYNTVCEVLEKSKDFYFQRSFINNTVVLVDDNKAKVIDNFEDLRAEVFKLVQSIEQMQKSNQQNGQSQKSSFANGFYVDVYTCVHQNIGVITEKNDKVKKEIKELCKKHSQNLYSPGFTKIHRTVQLDLMRIEREILDKYNEAQNFVDSATQAGLQLAQEFLRTDECQSQSLSKSGQAEIEQLFNGYIEKADNTMQQLKEFVIANIESSLKLSEEYKHENPIFDISLANLTTEQLSDLIFGRTTASPKTILSQNAEKKKKEEEEKKKKKKKEEDKKIKKEEDKKKKKEEDKKKKKKEEDEKKKKKKQSKSKSKDEKDFSEISDGSSDSDFDVIEKYDSAKESVSDSTVRSVYQKFKRNFNF